MTKSLHIHDDGFERELLALPTPLAFIDFETFSASPSPIPGTKGSDIIPCQWSCHTLDRHGCDWRRNLRHDEFLWTGDWEWSPVYAFVETLYNATRNAKTILIYTQYEVRVLSLCKQLVENDVNAVRRGDAQSDYVVVTASGGKVPLMEIAPKIAGWCDSIIRRTYDMCGNSGSGVKYWLQSPDFHNSNSIKHVFPVAMEEFSEAQELLRAYGIPGDGYEGLRRAGGIANGTECMTRYVTALNRPHRQGTDLKQDGAAPFDRTVEEQCLRYCCLDTLAMVVVYLAVLESTKRWRDVSSSEYAWVRFSDDRLVHKAYFDGDTRSAVKVCSGAHVDADKARLLTDEEIANLPIREQYATICPRCRASENRR